MDIENHPTDLSKFQEHIYRCTQIFPALMEDFLFDSNGPRPYSERLEGVLHRYWISGVMEQCRGKDTFKEGFNNYFYAKIMPRFSPEEYSQIRKIGQALTKRLRK